MSEHDNDLVSLGHAAAPFQQAPRLIELCLVQIGVAVPALTLNEVRYYRASDVARAIGHLATLDAADTLKAAKEARNHA